MVWYISNISDQSDHCSKHQLRRKISEKNCQREGCCKKKWTKDDAAQCMFIWPCYHQEDVVCLYFCILHCVCQQSNRDGPGGSPVTKAPSPSFTTTLWEGQTPQQKYHPPQLYPLWPQTIPYRGQYEHSVQHQPTPPNHIPPLYSKKLRNPPARNPALSLGHGQPGRGLTSRGLSLPH